MGEISLLTKKRRIAGDSRGVGGEENLEELELEADGESIKQHQGCSSNTLQSGCCGR